MSIARHHAEWLSLVEVSGPFLSMPVLLKVLPQGLDAHDPDHVRNLRLAYEEWEENRDGPRPKPALHDAWIRFVLGQTLGLPSEVLAEGQKIPQTIKATVPEHGETLRPDLMVCNPDGVPDAGKPRLLIQIYPASQNLDKPVAGLHWKASPATRMMELLHASDVRLGLVTNGDRWMLVDAPRGETTGFASWYASLWLDEQITLRAFRTLLGTHRFFAVPDNETLEAMLAESALNQQEVTDQLGYQVRKAVEVLIQSLDRADQDHGRELLAGLPETVLYEAALTVMMRLVFLFSAEEKKLIPAQTDDEFYLENYAVSTILDALRETADQHGEEILERRHDAWCRLLSTFRAVFGGVQHERLKLPAYAGNLFNPDRFRFLEGRREPKSGETPKSWREELANPLPVNNRTVLHLLEALQLLQVKVPGGGPAEARRLSFLALDIEQIGHVYESLLDHTAKRATQPMLGLSGSRDRELEIPLAELERLQAKGEDDLIAFLNEQTGRSTTALERALATKLDGDEASRCRAACGNDEKLWQRVQPFAGLLRDDTFGYPVVIRQKSVYVAAGTDRRSSGTHYTPRSLTEPIVRYTLEPLVYVGAAEGKPKEEWTLRSAREILSLKICDMACGSGAFLVQACRYLAERLMEAWEEEELRTPGKPRTSPEGTVSVAHPKERILEEKEDRELEAMRLVAQRCLYGVDKNPLAVEMAKLSLWLLTLAKDKPFTFLDHAIRPGDSLVGINDLRQIEVFNLACEGDGYPLILDFLKQRIKRAIELRRKLEEMPVKSVEDVQAQEELFQQGQALMDRAKVAADWLIAAEFQGGSESDREARRVAAAIQVAAHFDDPDFATFEREARKRLNGQPTFHWPLEFPEVMVERGGFDAFMGNPPFMGGRYISGQFGSSYLFYLKTHLANKAKGNADIVAYFYLRAQMLLRSNGTTGFVGTKTIAEGDTLDVGLTQLESQGAQLYSAENSKKWPGTASVLYVQLHWCKSKWFGQRHLDGIPVSFISPQLREVSVARPFPLNQTLIAYQGSYVHGMGFFLTDEERASIIANDPASQDCIFPCLTGDEFNNSPNLLGDRHVIYFADSEEQEAKSFRGAWEYVAEHVRPGRMKYTGTSLAKYWWRFKRPTKPLYDAIWKQHEVLVCPVVTKYLSFAWVPSRIVLLNKMYAFIGASEPHFAVVALCAA